MANRNLLEATSNLPQVLVSQQISSSEGVIYQGPANSSVTVKTASVCNTSGAAATVSLSVVKVGGTASAANRVAIITLNANESALVPELLVFLAPGDFISGVASSGSAVSIALTGAVSS